MTRHVLFQDPYHRYAHRLIRLLAERHGCEAVCFYTDAKVRFYAERTLPLPREGVAACHQLPPGGLEAFARLVRRRYRVAAVVPYAEVTVSTAARLLALLGVEWNDPDVLARFRDKLALKAFVQARDPGLRVNPGRPVRSAADVYAAPLPERFVLKPSDGYGGRDVGFFRASGDRDRVERFVAALPGRVLALERLVDGPEYMVNGQVDGAGEARVFHVLRYEPVEIGGRTTPYGGAVQVHPDDPAFAPLVAYARRVLRATGLVRSPFHLEARVDAEGPCLIDLGARPVGFNGAIEYDRMHGARFEALAAAARGYVSDAPCDDLGLDWEHYARTSFREVTGVATAAGRVLRVDGEREVEAHPHFRSWIRRVRPGDALRPDGGVFGIPWAVAIAHDGPMEPLHRSAAELRALVRINAGLGPLGRCSAGAVLLGRRVARRAAWELASRGHRAEVAP